MVISDAFECEVMDIFGNQLGFIIQGMRREKGFEAIHLNITIQTLEEFNFT